MVSFSISISFMLLLFSKLTSQQICMINNYYNDIYQDTHIITLYVV